MAALHTAADHVGWDAVKRELHCRSTSPRAACSLQTEILEIVFCLSSSTNFAKQPLESLIMFVCKCNYPQASRSGMSGNYLNQEQFAQQSAHLAVSLRSAMALTSWPGSAAVGLDVLLACMK